MLACPQHYILHSSAYPCLVYINILESVVGLPILVWPLFHDGCCFKMAAVSRWQLFHDVGCFMMATVS